MLDVHVHQLLLYAVFGQALIAFTEVFHRGNINLELLRCTLTLLQGSWFWEVNLDMTVLVQMVRLMCVDPHNSLFDNRLVLCCTPPVELSGT